jgi:RNA polymerase sigma-70 factor (ECF subfamily)
MALGPRKASERFYQVIWPHRAVVLRVAKMLTGNDAEADDLAQETLMKAFAAIASFRVGTDAKAWLLRILRNARVDRLRSGTRHLATSIEGAEIDVAAPDTPEPLDGWQEPEEILNAFSDAQIIHAMQKLPEEIRMTLLLVDVQQLDQSEAAEILDVPLGTIKSRTFRGRAMLRQTLMPLARELRLVR